jgi:signal transduction histidine kinase
LVIGWRFTVIKSLYIRLILTFIGAVIVSTAIGFFITTRLFHDRLTIIIEDDMIAGGKTIIQSYQQSYPDNLDALIKGMRALPAYSIRLFSPEGKPLHEAEGAAEDDLRVSDAQIRSVLGGGIYRSEPAKGFHSMAVGLPFSIEGQPYALFLSPHVDKIVFAIGVLFRIEFLIVLFFGSLFIMVSAIFIVRPLKRLTKATRRMARGDFSTRLHTKRKDEIGQLTRSFDQMAHELGTLEQIRRQFVSDVSHEIQTPLQSIKGFTQALKQKKLDEADRTRLLTIIEEESNRLSRLTADLLQLSTLESDHPSMVFRKYRLDEQLRHVFIVLEPQWSAKQLDAELDIEGISIAADRDKLNQLWTNLLGNAIKFTGVQGRIHVSAEVRHGRVEVSIADNGRGIPEEEIQHIFKPFYKVDKARERSIPGNGIGLSIVKRIVDLHEGDIRITSQEGVGTTFTIILPQDRSSTQ